MLWTTIKTCESLIKLLDGYHMIAPPRPSMIAAHVPVSAAPPGAALAKVPKTGPRARKSTLNVLDGSLAPLRVPHGAVRTSSPRRYSPEWSPVGELEYGRRADARGGRARVGLDSERGARVLGLEGARGTGRLLAHTRF